MLRDTFRQFGLPETALQSWFAVVLKDGFALSASGNSAPFGMIAGSALDQVFSTLGQSTPTGAVSKLLETFAKLPAHPDVRPAFELLQQAGVPAIALSNGNANATKGLIEKAGPHLVPQVLSVDEVAHWNRGPSHTSMLLKRRGHPASSIAMVAVHPWDTHGAKQAGMVAGWIDRGRRNFQAFFSAADVEAPTLDAVVQLLLELSQPKASYEAAKADPLHFCQVRSHRHTSE